MPTINIKDLPEFKTARLIDLTEDSINHIAEVVASKLNKSVKYGRWKQSKHYPHIIVCDECGEPYELSNSMEHWNYCPNCGARMDEGIEDAD